MVPIGPEKIVWMFLKAFSPQKLEKMNIFPGTNLQFLASANSETT